MSTPTTALPSPYTGLRPFEEKDRRFFFGRSRDQATIISNLYGSSLTVLYGASGVGKTSVLLAGVIPELEDNHRVAAVVFRQWQGKDFQAVLRAKILGATYAAVNRRLKANKKPELDAVSRLSEAINEKLRYDHTARLKSVKTKLIGNDIEAGPSQKPAGLPDNPPLLEDLSLDRFIIECANALGGRIFFILDQFEEYFLYHPATEDLAKDFDGQFALAVNSPEIPVSFLVSLRDDGLSKLDRLQTRIPNLLGNILRLEHLDRDRAREAIEKPLEKLNNDYQLTEDKKISIDSALIEALLEVRPDPLGIQPGPGRPSELAPDGSRSRVEMPFLQLVLRRLWKEEIERGSRRLTIAKFEELGGATKIVGDYLKDLMSKDLSDLLATGPPVLSGNALIEKVKQIRSDAATLFRYFVTTGGAKYAPTVSVLAEWAELDHERVFETVEVLYKLGVLRCVDIAAVKKDRRYEVFHDVLGEALREWREYQQRIDVEERAKAEAEKVKAQAEQRAAAQHRQVIWTRWVASAFLILFVAASGALAWAFMENLARQKLLRQACFGSFNQADRLIQLGRWSGGIPHLAHALKFDRANRLAEERFFYKLEKNRAQARRFPIFTFKHKGEVFQTVFSADGSRILTASTSEANLWDAAPPHRLLRSFQHEGSIYRAGFDHKGGRILTASADKTAKLWDATSGNLLKSFQHEGEVLQAVFSPDDRRILTASTDQTAKLWDAASGDLLQSFQHDFVVRNAVFSPDGSRILTASGQSATLWDTAAGKQLAAFQYPDEVLRVVFSPDGSRILTANGHIATLRDLGTGKLLCSVQHADKVLAAIFSPDGGRILTASADGFAKLWDVTSAKLGDVISPTVLASFSHVDGVSDAVFSPDGRRILTASADKTAKLWEAATGKLLGSLEHAGSVSAAIFSPDGNYILTASRDKSVKLWEANSVDLRPSFQHQKGVSMAVFSSDGRRVLTSGEDKTAELWDEESGKFLCSLEGEVLQAALGPDDQRILTTSNDKTAKLWDATSGKPIRSFQHASLVRQAVFSPDGRRILTASADKTAKLWDAATGKLLHSFQHQGEVYQAVFSADGQRILTASDDSTAKLWDGASGGLLHSFQHHGPVLQAVFSPDGRRILTASADKTANLWDAASGNLLQSFQHDSFVKHAIFSSNGKLILTAGGASAAELWDAESGRLLHPFQHQGDVCEAVFSPDGQLILTASEDKTAKLWDAGTYNLLASFQHDAPVTTAIFSADGGHILTASGNRAELWDVAIPMSIFEELRHSNDDLVNEIECLAEIATGASMSDEGKPFPVEDEKRRNLVAQLRAGVPAASKLSNHRFVRWFTSPEKELTVFPTSNEPANLWGKDAKTE